MCKPGWEGMNCEEMATTMMPTMMTTMEPLPPECLAKNCTEKSMNQQCDVSSFLKRQKTKTLKNKTPNNNNNNK